jgi:hypothetical protein
VKSGYHRDRSKEPSGSGAADEEIFEILEMMLMPGM